MNYILYILAGIILKTAPFDCVCPPPDTSMDGFEEARQNVVDVFLGLVISIDTIESTYVVQIVEVFKGDLSINQQITGVQIPSCGPYVDKIGNWLFFGHNETKFSAEVCGHSFFIEEPRVFPPPPPPPVVKNTEKSFKEIHQQWKLESASKGQAVLEYFRKE